MATWLEVQSFIKSNYQISSEDIDGFSLVFDTGEGRSQMIRVARVGAGTPFEMLYFLSPFARVEDISAEQFVAASEESALGVKRTDDFYSCVHGSFLEDLDASEIDKALLWISHQADSIEQLIGLGDSF